MGDLPDTKSNFDQDTGLLLFNTDNNEPGRHCDHLLHNRNSTKNDFYIPIITPIVKPVTVHSPRAEHSPRSPKSPIKKSPRETFKRTKRNRTHTYNLDDAVYELETGVKKLNVKRVSSYSHLSQYTIEPPNPQKSLNSIVSPRSAFAPSKSPEQKRRQ